MKKLLTTLLVAFLVVVATPTTASAIESSGEWVKLSKYDRDGVWYIQPSSVAKTNTDAGALLAYKASNGTVAVFIGTTSLASCKSGFGKIDVYTMSGELAFSYGWASGTNTVAEGIAKWACAAPTKGKLS